MSANRNAAAELVAVAKSRRAKTGARVIRGIESSIKAAMADGFVIGREVFLDRVPGIVVAYNITSVGHFIGQAYPVVVRTAYGVTKCRIHDLSLA